MATKISNTDDVIDSRDVIERIEELESEQEDFKNEDGEFQATPEFAAWEESEGAELDALRALAEEAEGSPDWQYGETLIRYSYFKDYAQELAEDCGMLTKSTDWPNRCIDWDQAASELQMDYMSVDFDGVEYFIRA